MVIDGKLKVKAKNGKIYDTNITRLKSYKTLQTLSMNHHGLEKYSFALIEDIQPKKISGPVFTLTVTNHLDQVRTFTASPDTQVYITGKKWSGFVNLDKLRKNAILVDYEDRPNRILEIEKTDVEDVEGFDIKVMYTGNFFYNGILVR